MRTTVIAPLAAVLATTALPATAQAQPRALEPSTHWQRGGCSKPVTRAEYRQRVRRVYRLSHAGGDFHAREVRRGRLKLKQARRCAYTERMHTRMIRYTDQRKDAWRWYRRIDAITAYGKWAIPWSIVSCESGGSWSAYNPSGASGPYQLLGWGAPMPADTPAEWATHHEIAARLWSGGSGASHWTQCL